MEFEKWAKVLAETETGNNFKVIGDHGEAIGRWQMHPAFFYNYQPADVLLTDTWDEVFKRTLFNFYNQYPDVDPIYLAMMFHLGVTAVTKQHKWDEHYAVKFIEYMEKK